MLQGDQEEWRSLYGRVFVEKEELGAVEKVKEYDFRRVYLKI
jgi:hypothetical protein